MSNTASAEHPLPEIQALHDAGMGTVLVGPDIAPNGVFVKANSGGRPWENAEGLRATSWGVYHLGYRAPNYGNAAAA